MELHWSVDFRSHQDSFDYEKFFVQTLSRGLKIKYPDSYQWCKKKYRILPSKKENVGYTKAFEYLVQSSKGKYVAFAIRCVTGRAGRGKSGIPMTILALKIFFRLAHQACV